MKVHELHYANELLVRIRLAGLAFPKLVQTSQTSKNNKKLSKTGFGWQTHRLTRYRSKQFSSYRTFLYRTNTKVCACGYSQRADSIYSQREIKEILDPEKTPFPLKQSIKVHRRALVLLLYLIPCLRCEKSARESRNSRHFITQRDNIHARAQDTLVDQRGYMTSGWRNLF